MKNKRETGSCYEKSAAAFLTGLGYEILEKNFYCRQGEIDLIARDGRYLVFVEVKYRKTAKSGDPAEAVDARKQKRMFHAARYYLICHGYPEDTACRFDVVTVLGEDMKLYRDAFWG